MSEARPLDGHVVLITGASSGMGEATARMLVSRGARVVLGARRGNALDALVAELGEEHAAALRTDVTKEDDVKALVAFALERFGRLDAAFANAGIGGGGTLLDGEPDRWREMLLVNVHGLALTVHHAVKPMLAAGRGHIVLTSSVVGRRILDALPMYSASKFAVTAIGEGLRRELAGKVRVTMVEPGATKTDFPLQHLGFVLEAEDIARVVVFALEQPEHVAINEVLVRPAGQVF